jgi:hypothetical protein
MAHGTQSTKQREQQHDGNYHSRDGRNILYKRGHFRNLGNPRDHEGESIMTWTIDGCISMQNLDIVRSGSRIAMIDCENEALSDGDILANARLIAAAPDLLAVLCEMLGAAETDLLDDKSNVWRSAMNDARAAITKAQGV